MKRRYVLMMALVSCNVTFSQHPYSHGHGGALYWGLVGALAYVFWFLVLRIVPALWFLFKEMLNRAKERKSTESSKPLDSGNTCVASVSTDTSYSEEVIILDASETLASVTELIGQDNPEDSIRVDSGIPKFCHHCGAKIDYESGKFCKYCGNELV